RPGSSRPAHTTLARRGLVNTPSSVRAESNGSASDAAPATASLTSSTNRGHVQPRNFSVTCQLSGLVHRATGTCRRNPATVASSPRLTSSGTSTATNSLSGFASGREARSPATKTVQVPPQQVEGGLFGPPPDHVAIA